MAAASYFIGLLAFVAFLISFMILLRLPIQLSWFVLEILTGLVIHLIASVVGFILLEDFSYWYQASLYAVLWFCFFFVSSIYSVSVSIGIISYLYDQPSHCAQLDEVYQHCIIRDFEKRAEFLVATRQAQKTEQGYLSTAAGKRTARRLQLIQKILGMESQGFYCSDPVLLINQKSIEHQ